MVYFPETRWLVMGQGVVDLAGEFTKEVDRFESYEDAKRLQNKLFMEGQTTQVIRWKWAETKVPYNSLMAKSSGEVKARPKLHIKA